MCCPMMSAWDLHKAWPEADFKVRELLQTIYLACYKVYLSLIVGLSGQTLLAFYILKKQGRVIVTLDEQSVQVGCPGSSTNFSNFKDRGQVLHILYNGAPLFAYRESCVIHYAVSDGAEQEYNVPKVWTI